MAIRNFSISAKQIFQSNLLLIICCAFYLAWWLLAFKPDGAVKGMKTGWLLIPAFAAGLAAIVLAVMGMRSAPVGTAFFPDGLPVWAGLASYFILVAVTRLFFKRPVTTELFLIVGWAVLALSEINTLYGIRMFSHARTVLLTAVIGAAALISLICYVLYYRLEKRPGYFDGMVPLWMVAFVTAGISAAMVI